MQINLIYKKRLVAEIGYSELLLLFNKYGRKLPYQIVLATDNEKDIKQLERLKIPFKLEWEGKYS